MRQLAKVVSHADLWLFETTQGHFVDYELAVVGAYLGPISSFALIVDMGHLVDLLKFFNF